MAKVLGLALALALGITIVAGMPEECGECDRSQCPDVGVCVGGAVPDVCGCCSVCSRGLGQRCEIDTEARVRLDDEPGRYGLCGDHLVCRPRSDVPGSDEAVCECEETDEVCGSDGNTYPTLCHLLEESANNPDIYVAVRGPCKSVPLIKTVPNDAVRPEGSIMVLDCEAIGYPVPEMSWELNRNDGSSFRLPADNPLIAIQARGGPEQFMVTGWVQIMRVNKDTIGTYTCIATNSEGEARASAKLVLNDDKRNEV